MNTPIVDFVRRYAEDGAARLHMPGHKGRGPMGCEMLDITEIHGADALYEASGIIAESENNAAGIFDSGATIYSTEGSSQCIKAMMRLAAVGQHDRTGRAGKRPVILAARNVHKSFVYAAAMLDLEVVWLMPEVTDSICSCIITPERLRAALERMEDPPAAVYITSPDYLGNIADILALASVCHEHGTLLTVDNAHGAYLRFLPQTMHPINLGADMCCDSAHKTLPVLTGGAYLHISRGMAKLFAPYARDAMALFGSTSPSYLILQSLDSFNGISDGYRSQLAEHVRLTEAIKEDLCAKGWQLIGNDPARITVAAPEGMTGMDLAKRLRQRGAECEYADRDRMVMMTTPYNAPGEITAAAEALGENGRPYQSDRSLELPEPVRVMTIRDAVLAPQTLIPAAEAVGRVCGTPAVSCPPAVPISVAGEIISPEAAAVFDIYGIENVSVISD